MKKKFRVFSDIIIFALVIIMSVAFITLAENIVYKKVYPKKYSEYVEKYAQKYSVDSNLIYSVIFCESRFNPNAISNKNARGLMQIQKDTFDWAYMRMNDKRAISYDNIYDIEVNIEFGTYILSLLNAEFKNRETALAAYHAGWGNVKNWLVDSEKSLDGITIDKIPFADTKRYVEKVSETYDIYKHIYR